MRLRVVLPIALAFLAVNVGLPMLTCYYVHDLERTARIISVLLALALPVRVAAAFADRTDSWLAARLSGEPDSQAARA